MALLKRKQEPCNLFAERSSLIFTCLIIYQQISLKCMKVINQTSTELTDHFCSNPPPPIQGYFSTEVVTILHVPFNPPIQSYFSTEVVTILHVPFNPPFSYFRTEVVTILHVPFNPPIQSYFSTEVVTILHVPFNPPFKVTSEVVTIFHVPFNPNSKLFRTEVVTIFHVPFNPLIQSYSEQKWLQSFMYPLI